MTRDRRQILTEWLVLEAQQGREVALRELMALWTADFHRLARVRVERPDAVAEVVNDTWLDIARGLPQLDDPARFPRWSMQILFRRSADWVRRRTRERRREQLAAEQADTLAPAGLAEVNEEPSDELTAVRRAIFRLPVEQQELLHLYYVLERSVKEIAEILRVPAGTVKSRLFAAREALKPLLEKEPHE